jgi:2'-5' RNA ligase
VSERTIGVAVAIPEPYGSELQAHRESFGDALASSIPTHITLLPPTPVPAADFDRIKEHLRKVADAEHPFEIHLRGTGTFHPVSPVVFTVAHDLPKGTLERAFDALANYDVRFPVWGFSLYEHGNDGVWRPHREFTFGRPVPVADTT